MGIEHITSDELIEIQEKAKKWDEVKDRQINKFQTIVDTKVFEALKEKANRYDKLTEQNWGSSETITISKYVYKQLEEKAKKYDLCGISYHGLCDKASKWDKFMELLQTSDGEYVREIK